MNSRFPTNGRVRPGHSFQADRYSHRERMVREMRGLRAWWRDADGLERFTRLWWWAVCFVLGVPLGVGCALIFGAVVVVLR